MRKEHLEILLEDIRGKCDRLLAMLAAMNRKVEAVADDLKAHRQDTEAHRRGWRVCEGDSE